MKYSAGIVSKPFWYQETKKTAKLICDELSKEQIKQKLIIENEYQAQTEYRAKQIFNTAFRRLSALNEYLIRAIAFGDFTTSKILVIISVMCTDKLFFEYVYQVYRKNIIIGENELKDKDYSIFMFEKINQSETIAKWSKRTQSDLKRYYTKILYEAGLIKKNMNGWLISNILIDSEIYMYLINNGYSQYVYAITGEK